VDASGIASDGQSAQVGDGDRQDRPIDGTLPRAAEDGGPIDRGTSADAPGAAVDAAGGDPPPPRPLSVTASKARHQHTFNPSQADPSVNTSTTFSDGIETAIIDPRARPLGKLVMTLGGVGSESGFVGGIGSFCAARGFHVFAVTYFSSYDIVRGDAAFYGDARLESFEGVDHTNKYEFATVHIDKPDGIEQRVARGLAYLQGLYPDEDWGYYLNGDGSVRWSDVIVAGFSHGASSAARIAMVRRLAGAISLSGPRDNSCGSDPLCGGGGVFATWLTEVPRTPIDRFFALTGAQDGQHPEHLFAMQKVGYLGQVVDVDVEQPPYGGSHRLKSTGGGHSDYCGGEAYQAACNYMFHVPPENQAGVP
jgi:hypothetical protein